MTLFECEILFGVLSKAMLNLTHFCWSQGHSNQGCMIDLSCAAFIVTVYEKQHFFAVNLDRLYGL